MTDLQSRVRSSLPLLRGLGLVRVSDFDADVVEVLLDRGLATDRIAAGYIQAEPRAQAYIADPSQFEIDDEIPDRDDLISLALEAATELYAREIGAGTKTPCARCGCTAYCPYDDFHECEYCGLPFGQECPDEDRPMLVEFVVDSAKSRVTVCMMNTVEQRANVTIDRESGLFLGGVFIAPSGVVVYTIAPHWIAAAQTAWTDSRAKA